MSAATSFFPFTPNENVSLSTQHQLPGVQTRFAFDEPNAAGGW